MPHESTEANAAYPPVPPAPRTNTEASASARSVKRSPSPPRLVVNGISATASNSFAARKNSSEFDEVLASGSTIRRGERQEEESYAPITPQRQSSSPVIPLSPDPFGRFSSNFSSNFTPLPPNFVSYTDPNPPNTVDESGSSSRFSADSLNGADAAKMGKGEKSGASLVSVKSVKKLWKKSKKLSISGQQSISIPASNPPPLPGSSQEQFDWPPTPLSPLPPPTAPPPAVKHSRVDSAYDHFHFDQESPYPVRKSMSAKASQPSISERPISPPLPAQAPDRSSIRKSILKGWKPPSAQLQPQFGALEPRLSAEHSGSGERPPPNPNDSVTGGNRRPSILDASMNGSVSSSPNIPQGAQVPAQYGQNGRVAGLSIRRKSKPAIIPLLPTDPPHRSPPPIPSPFLAAGLPEGPRGSDTSHFEMVSPR